MSLIPKSQGVLSVVFILTLIGSLSVTAQTPTENTAISNPTSVASTIQV